MQRKHRRPSSFRRLVAAAGALLVWTPLAAQPRQTQQDEYAIYDLLAASTGTFRTVYEVAVTTPDATTFFDRVGDGLTPVSGRDDSVVDLMTGAPLSFVMVGGAEARARGFSEADPRSQYLSVRLARAVPPQGGQARIRIIKTYKDAKSYHPDGDGLVLDRPIGIRHVAVVLPAGYHITECNIPSQVVAEPDGRLRLSFMYQGPGPAALVIKAKPGAPIGDAAKPHPLTDRRSWESPPLQGPTERARLAERAHQDRDIVYFLRQPDTQAFSLYHDYTESREGVDKYLNVVRTGSIVSNPSAKVLDTGEELHDEILTGAQMKAAGIDSEGEQVAPDQQVVISRFAPVKKGQSVRLRMSETYTAPESYRLEGDEFVFDRSFGRPRNSVVLPPGWYLTALSIPATIRQTPDGLTRIDFVNGRPDAIDVLMKGRKLITAR